MRAWWGIASVISRHALLWSLLALHVATIYVAVLVLAGVSEDGQAVPWSLNLVALVLVALTLLPVRAWLAPRIDELLRSDPEDPYGAIIHLNAQLDAAPDSDTILPIIAQTIARALRLTWVRIEDHREPDVRVSEVGRRASIASPIDVPLGFQGVRVGLLRVAPRWPEGGMSAHDRRLLDDLARQVGITLYAMRLTDDLQAARERLVAAREEERLRLRRDLHDGLGPTLSAMRLQLRSLQTLLRSDPDRAEAMVDELRADLRATTAEIRVLVFALRPPLLDEHGLLGAIRQLDVALGDTALHVDAPPVLPVLPAAVEVAAYRIAAEAMHNVARHAQATRCYVRLRIEEGGLLLSVEDDGAGLVNPKGDGVGLHSMRERATELGGRLTVDARQGGGTQVEALLPFVGSGAVAHPSTSPSEEHAP